jgi:periplasmic protein CpxP/Spy
MKEKTMLRFRSVWLAAALIVSTMLVTAPLTHAQPAAPRGDRMFSRLQRTLGLTDDQVTQIRAIYGQHRDAQRNLWQSLRQAQTDLRQLALGGGDANAIAAKKTEVAQLLAQGLDQRVQTLQQIAPVLTPEQRDKLAQMGPAAMWRGHRGPRPPRAQS